ncbi:MAG: hypothetical protein KGY60_00915 [Bacteroidales bacterium]|nr:hypothetical protein [Bacteroidales bacterium]
MDNQAFHRWYKRLIEDPPQAPPEIVWEHISLELDREFYDWYRTTLEEGAPVPPAAVWDNIEDNLDSGLHQWYQTSIEEPTEEPPQEVWSNIQDQLDIDDTWVGISRELDRKWKKRTRQLVYALAAAVLLLFALQIFLPTSEHSPFRESTTPVAQEEKPQPDKKQEEQATQEPGEKQQEPIPQTPSADQRERKERLAMGKDQSATADSRESEKEEKTQERKETDRSEGLERLADRSSMTLAKADPTQIQLNVQTNEQLASMPETGISVSQTREDKEQPGQVRYYAGISGEVGNSWLLSNKTIYSIRKSPYSSASPEVGKSYGIMGGASLNDHFDVQAEALFTSETGQKYREYTNGQVLHNQILLNYTSLKITGRYKIFGSSFQLPVSHHLVLGTYGSYLKNAQQQTDGQTKNIKGAYKNYNLGVVVGYELDTHIAPNYSLSAGLRFNPGFINIYEGTSMLPAQFNKTYSSSVNINIALKYNLSSQ